MLLFITHQICAQDTVKVNELFYKANVAYNMSDYVSAIPLYSTVIEEDDKNVDAYLYRAICYDAVKNYSASISDYQEAIHLNPENKFGYRGLGRIREKLKDYKGAIEAYSEGLKNVPDECYFYSQSAVCYKFLKDTISALKYLDICINNALCNNADCYTFKARIMWEHHKNSDAMDLYNKCIEKFPSYQVAYFRRGQLYFDMDDYKRAISDFQKTIQYITDSSYDKLFDKSYAYLGDSYRLNKQYSESIKPYSICLEKYPNSLLVYLGRSTSYAELNQKELSYKDLKYYEEHGGNRNKLYYTMKSEILDIFNDYEGLLSLYNEQIKNKILDTGLYFKRGMTYYYLGKCENAKQDFAIYLASDSRKYSWRTPYSNAIINICNKNYKEALKCYEKSLHEVDGERAAGILYDMGKLKYTYLHQYSSALRDFQQANELDSTIVKRNPEYYLCLAGIKLSDKEQDKKLESIPSFNEYIKAKPDYYYGYYVRGKFYQSLHNYELAIADLNKALILAAKNKNPVSKVDLSIMHFLLGDSYAHTGKTEEGLLSVNKAIGFNPTQSEYYACRADYKVVLDMSYEEVMKDITKAIELNSENGLYYFMRAHYRMNDRFKRYFNDDDFCSDINDAMKLGIKDKIVQELRAQYCR